jgi:hypothetical protein
MKVALQTVPVEELVTLYEQTSAARGRSMMIGDSKSANKAFDEETAIRHELARRGEDALKLLLPLLKSSDPWVRYDSSAPALFFAPNEAEPVLEELTRQPRSLGVSARMTLQQWKSGKLHPF